MKNTQSINIENFIFDNVRYLLKISFNIKYLMNQKSNPISLMFPRLFVSYELICFNPINANSFY